MAYLRHLFNGETVTLYELGEAIKIGRHADSDIRIEDLTVSATHCRLAAQAGGWWLEDMQSTNGTLMNGERVTRVQLAPNDVFNVGTHAFEFLPQLPTEFDKTLSVKKSWIPGIYYTE